MKQIRQRLTYANVMSSISVFFILGGATAFAATKIGSNELKANSVITGKIKKEAVTEAKIKAGAITTGKLANAAVTSDKLAANAVGTANLVDGSVSTAKLGADAVTSGKLGDNAVTTSKLGNAAVTTGKLGNSAVTTGKIENGAVTNEKLATAYLPAATIGVPVAGANVAADGTVRKSFNRFGGAPTVTKGGTGIYNLSFPGLEGQAFFDSSIMLATLGGGTAGQISRASAGGNPQVDTFSAAGAAADREFEMVLFVPGS